MSSEARIKIPEPPSPGQHITVELCDEPMTDEVRASER